jgi:2-polyprenyl-3-methyl-5-hydroxy-6-metoxy-1,4-benzoquinol methylase
MIKNIFERLLRITPRFLIQLVPEKLKAILISAIYRQTPTKAVVPAEPPTSPAMPKFSVICTISELEKKLVELEAAAAISDDALRAAFTTFSMDFSNDVPSDPYSEAYRRKQFEIYTFLAGKPYSVANEVSHFNVQNCATSPFPFCTESCDTVGNQLISIGFLIKTLALAPKSRILEFGPGWGNTTEFLARMGYEVTAVDIEQNFVDLINERAKRNHLTINAIRDDFSYIESVREPYDAILFFECFHHASDHLRLIKAFAGALKPGGKVIFAAEPITDAFPLPWGIRLDGESLWAIRKHGWLELGFQEQYFRKTMKKSGWSITKQCCTETPWGTIFVATGGA